MLDRLFFLRAGPLSCLYFNRIQAADLISHAIGLEAVVIPDFALERNFLQRGESLIAFRSNPFETGRGIGRNPNIHSWRIFVAASVRIRELEGISMAGLQGRIELEHMAPLGVGRKREELSLLIHQQGALDGFVDEKIIGQCRTFDS